VSVPDSSVQGVRHFNRFYTRKIGVLREGHLDSSLSLTEARVLYELSHREEATATGICAELGLDPGYLSRILRAFERRGWIRRRASAEDGRRQLLSLTKAGRAAFAPLDARSNEEVRRLLAAVAGADRARLLNAMRTIEAALEPAAAQAEPFTLRSHRPGDLGWVVHRHGLLYSQEWRYDERFEALVARIVAEFVENLEPRRERCWVAERGGEPVGSVFLVQKTTRVAKLRLLLVEPSARGLGIGRRLVGECVAFARHCGYRRIVLWTQSELKAARSIYEQSGFELIAEQRHDSWGRSGLVSETWELRL
jgi:DNA-binding MarR family transcriptional regulator/predicted N-acetyltransferase YhbS